MKKLTLVLAIVVALTMGVVGVAAEEDSEVVTNMDKDTFIEIRSEQIEQALADGVITQEQADLLIEHIMEIAEDGTFGRGNRLNNNDVECVLGDDGNLGIFRNGGLGSRIGAGNGTGLGKGLGNRGGLGSRNGGSRQNNENCIYAN